MIINMELKPVFPVILGVISVVYLVSLFFKTGVFQGILKGCLLPLVFTVYIFGARHIIWPVISGLFFGWLGDIFLLKISDTRFFRFGLAGFLLGHICYIISMAGFVRPLNITALVISIIAAAALGLFVFKLVRPTVEMKIPVIAYEAIIFTMVVFALQLFLAQSSPFGGFVFAGSVCFVISDTILAYDTFRKKTRFGFFIVMLTYIAAQLCITLGFCSA
ncbi:MAG: lysoplasmalogenase [Treponema sp.]|nr:lysoplasmalogenase [Treponema sp.]